MRPIIYPYKMRSKSAKLLSTELQRRGYSAVRVRPDGNYTPYTNHLIINWGNSGKPNWGDSAGCVNMLNSCTSVAYASNKLATFRRMQVAGVAIPAFTNDLVVAEAWIFAGAVVLARSKLSGHSGEGISIHDTIDDLPTVPLYVNYIKKQSEYRIHVFRDIVIDTQQKRKRSETPNEEVNYQVRNHANGWVYARDNCDLNVINDSDQSVYEKSNMIHGEAIKAVRALGLDFGAVDVIWNEHHKQCYVLEVNTAPGLEGTTLTKYANAIEALL